MAKHYERTYINNNKRKHSSFKFFKLLKEKNIKDK